MTSRLNEIRADGKGKEDVFFLFKKKKKETKKKKHDMNEGGSLNYFGFLKLNLAFSGVIVLTFSRLLCCFSLRHICNHCSIFL